MQRHAQIDASNFKRGSTGANAVALGASNSRATNPERYDFSPAPPELRQRRKLHSQEIIITKSQLLGRRFRSESIATVGPVVEAARWRLPHALLDNAVVVMGVKQLAN